MDHDANPRISPPAFEVKYTYDYVSLTRFSVRLFVSITGTPSIFVFVTVPIQSRLKLTMQGKGRTGHGYVNAGESANSDEGGDNSLGDSHGQILGSSQGIPIR